MPSRVKGSDISLAEGHGQEQQLTHIKLHIAPACKNLSTDNKPAIRIFFFQLRQKKKKLHSAHKCLTIWKYILGQFKQDWLPSVLFKIAMVKHPFSQLGKQKMYFFCNGGVCRGCR